MDKSTATDDLAFPFETTFSRIKDAKKYFGALLTNLPNMIYRWLGARLQ